MIVFLLFIVVVLIGLTTAAVMGRIGGSMSEPTASHAFAGLPNGSVSADDIGALTFDTALRGYRMDQVDEVVDVLVARLREVEGKAAVDQRPADDARPPSVARASVPDEGVGEGLDGGVGEGAGEGAGKGADGGIGEGPDGGAGEDTGLLAGDSRRSRDDRDGA